MAAGLFSATQVAGVLTLGSRLIHAGVAGRRDLEALTAKVKQLRVENRGPTAEEWATLSAQIAGDSARIQEAAQEAQRVDDIPADTHPAADAPPTT